jgi:SEC-C motif
MNPGRNEPCPCGSGRKYKHCCLREPHPAVAEPAPSPPAEARGGDWEADLLPVPVAFDDQPDARPGVVLVTGHGGFVLATDVLTRPSGEPGGVAAELARQVRRAADAAGGPPARVLVRDPEVAASLARELAGDAIEVRTCERLPGIDRAAGSLLEHMTGRPVKLRAATAETWAGWDQPAAWVAELFAAAAAFYRAAPWQVLGGLDGLAIATAGGRPWWGNVFGQGGSVFGLSLFSDLGDLLSSAFEECPQETRGRALSLLYNRRGEIPPRMARELARQGWEVAGPAAYPSLIAINTPGGGLARADAADLLAVLGALPRVLAAWDLPAGHARADLSWRDPQSGLAVSLFSLAERLAQEAGHAAPPPLAPGGPEGPTAEPEAALVESDEPERLVESEQAVVERFERALQDGGLADSTVARHRAAAAIFIDFLAAWQGVPLRAVHEYDLRSFLYDWYPRKVHASATDARAIPSSLRRFFAFLAEHEGLRCAWAEPLLRDRRAFLERWESCPDGFFWDDAIQHWRAAAIDDLVDRRLIHDWGLGERGSWGELQGMTEARLQRELQRRWLLWRDELLRGGGMSRNELAEALVARQRAWEAAPHPDLGGRTPLAAIAEERRALPKPPGGRSRRKKKRPQRSR